MDNQSFTLTPEQKEKWKLKQKSYQENPQIFFNEILGTKAHWDKQIDVANSVAKNRKTTVRSGHGVGKSYVGADIALWFLYTYPRSIVITTAPTWRQVEKVLWGEIGAHWTKAVVPLGGKLLETEIKIGPKWYATGFSSDTRDAFQGFHADHILIIADEPSGIEDETAEQIESMMVNTHARLLLIGNPIRNIGFFHDSFLQPSFNKIHISCLDSPNVKAGKTIIPGLVTKEWVEERKAEWGEDSAIYQSRVLGNFPSESEDVLIKLAWTQDSVIRWSRNEGLKITGRTVVGLDIARFGSNKTVFVVRTGRRVREIVAYQGYDLMHTVGVAQRIISKYQPDDFMLDDNGVGGGVTDRLRELGHKMIVPVIAGAEADDKKRYQNKKSELAWRVREAFRNDELDIPDNEQMIFECTNQYYDTTMEDSKLRVMSKSLLRKKKVKSPDHFDALALTYEKEMPSSLAKEHAQYSIEFYDFVHVQRVDPRKLEIGTSRFCYLVPTLNGSTVLLWACADRKGLIYFYREALVERASSSAIMKAIAAVETEKVDERYVPRMNMSPEDQDARYNLIEQLQDHDLYFEEFDYNEQLAGLNLREGLSFNPDLPFGADNHPFIYFSPDCPLAVRAVKHYLNPKTLQNEPLFETLHKAVGLAVLTEPIWLKEVIHG